MSESKPTRDRTGVSRAGSKPGSCSTRPCVRLDGANGFTDDNLSSALLQKFGRFPKHGARYCWPIDAPWQYGRRLCGGVAP